MRWRRHWPARQPRPETRTLTDDEREKLLTTMTREIAASPVLTGLGLQVHLRRGRFYLERPFPEGAVEGTEAWGRITPLDDAKGTLLLEQGRPADAERVFREALERRPHNGWSLVGLEQALRAQRRTADADQALAAFQQAWTRSDTWLPRPRF